jgi:hypothetical protein
MILNLADNEAMFLFELVLHKGKFKYLSMLYGIDHEKLAASLDRHTKHLRTKSVNSRNLEKT